MGRKKQERLPTLQKGINILRTSENRSHAIHSLAINHLLLFGGDAVWIDSGNLCSSELVSRLSPVETMLERIKVARAFTAYQHFSLVETVSRSIDSRTNLIVVPLADLFYQKDPLNRKEGFKLLSRTMQNIRNVSSRYGIPVLLTESKESVFDTVSRYGENTIKCENTRMGLKFSSNSFKTLTYSGPGYLQTTLRLWELILKQTYNRRKEVIKNGENQPYFQKSVKAS